MNPRRIPVDGSLPPVQIPAEVLHELCKHALEALPEECCGLVLGTEDERFEKLVRCENQMTSMHQSDPETHPRDGRSAFYMSERDVVRVRQLADETGRAVTAVYHSHVGAPAYFSELDRSYAEHALFPFPDADQIVVEVFGKKVGEKSLFRRVDAGFVGHRLEGIAR